MEQPTYSFTYDLKGAQKIFKGVAVRELVRGTLGSLEPKHDWNGCLIFEGPSPEDENETACVATRGDGAEELNQLLIEAFERLGIRVLYVYEGGPEVRQQIARTDGVRWQID